MNVSFRGDGTFSILMKEYLIESIDEYGEKVVGTTSTPARKYMFSVDENSEVLDENRSKRFHSITTKLLYVSNRARVDLKLSIAFLSTRVTKSTIQDWEKLKRVLRYVQGTIDMPRILGADSMLNLVT